MRWQPGVISLQAEHERNVVAAIVSTAEANEGVRRGERRSRISGGEAVRSVNALRTTRSTLAIFRDASALLSLAQDGSPRE